MKKKRILIADDDQHVRKALKARLIEWGYDVIESSDGLGVLSRTTPDHVDALILDHEMPLGQGRNIAGLIRQETTAPIIFLSGHDREDFSYTLNTLPDMYYLSKPMDAGRLEQILAACLASGDAATDIYQGAA